MTPVMGYWSVRGRGEPIRALLHYTGTEFEERLYHMRAGPPDLQRTEWTSAKPTLGLEFPNLPYYIDGSLEITETQAILRYIGRKTNMMGNSEADSVRIDMAFGILSDLWEALRNFVYGPDYDTKKVHLIARCPDDIKKMSKLVGSGNYILGDKISVVDFLLVESMERYLDFQPDCLAGFPNLSLYHQRYLNLPAVKEYRATVNFQKYKTRFHGINANFGAGKDSY